MLGDRHELDVGEAEFVDVGGEFDGELTVRQALPPGGEMDLVDREGRLVDRGLRPPREPGLVVPLVVRGRHDGRGGGRHLRAPGHRVGLQEALPVPGGDLELVARALADARQEQLPHTRRTERPHRERRAVPGAELPADTHPLGVRGPHREPGAGHSAVCHRLRAERLPQLLVPPLADEVQIEVAEGGQETVRVVDLVLVVLRVRHQQGVLRERVERQHAREEATPVGGERGARPLDHDAHGPRVGPQHPEDEPARHLMRAEQRVRVVVGAREEAVAVGGVQGSGGAPGCGRGRAARLLR